MLVLAIVVAIIVLAPGKRLDQSLQWRRQVRVPDTTKVRVLPTGHLVRA